MFRLLISALGALALTLPTAAQVQRFPTSFRTQDIQTDGARIHVRVGGQGPAVVLLHGFGDTGDMWAPLAADLARDHVVVVPDLRGMALSSHPDGGYDKRTQAADIRSVLTQLGLDRAAIVGHDIGTMVAYAYAARYPDQTDLSALHVEKTAAFVGLSDTTAAYEVARWQRRAKRMYAAAGVIRGLIAQPDGAVAHPT
jgi:pimeloyl-ACP methyl ester carboxylesterase